MLIIFVMPLYLIYAMVRLWISIPQILKALIFRGLTKREQYYNDTIDKLCNKFSNSQYAYYNYSVAKDYITRYLNSKHFSKREIKRALKEIEGQEERNGPEYPFYVRGRSSCFLLQTFLKQTKYEYYSVSYIINDCLSLHWH